MHSLRRIACLIFPDVMSLDVTGPMQVFASANVELSRIGQPAAYELLILADSAGPVATSAGLRLHADQAWRDIDPGQLDTLLIPGGSNMHAQCENIALRTWLQASQPRIRRLGSVCSGALILASAGLLDGLIATTHWDDIEALSRYSAIDVQPDRLHTYDPDNRNGNAHLFTSAGVTAGIDLALALVEADLGRELALAVARRLVMFLKRPGGQTQFSACLAPQASRAPRLSNLLEWIPAHLHESLTLETLATQAGMAPRTLYRVFLSEVGVTPGRHIERVRLEAARALLQSGQASIGRIARQCGFGHPENLRRTFQKNLGVSPQAYAERFGSHSSLQ
ncbi:GlxA family transcriptional regulator [Pseudomonas akapageensis]|uniref:GlxA family transcriptional regulator n=1 Tax=Pseudomonas akapageensis TaxID=2609961 RepID=UPI00140A9757|nr:GlxA family transcriptional regulator [Pseudomonas akapageensis]